MSRSSWYEQFKAQPKLPHKEHANSWSQLNSEICQTEGRTTLRKAVGCK